MLQGGKPDDAYVYFVHNGVKDRIAAQESFDRFRFDPTKIEYVDSLPNLPDGETILF